MSSIRTPQEKKRLAYQRDHYSDSKYDKARNGWRIKKHKARRAYRHAADILTRAAAFDGESDSMISTVKRRPASGRGVLTLRERVARQLNRRVRRVGRKVAAKNPEASPATPEVGASGHCPDANF